MTTKRKKVAGSKSAAVDIADDLFGKIIRYGRCCAECGSPMYIQCAHGFSRRYRATRWHRDNAWPLCRACHKRYTENPLKWEVWLRTVWGDEKYDEMRDLALNGTTPDPREVVAELRPIWNQLEAA